MIYSPKHQGYLFNLDHAMCRNLMVTTSSNMHDKLCLQHAEDDEAMAGGGAVVTDVSDESSGDGAVPDDSDTVRGPRQVTQF